MDIQSISLTANLRTALRLPGRFFMLVETGAPLEVGFELNGATTGERARNVEAGYVRMPGDWADLSDRFDGVVLESDTNQTVRIGISEHAADYRRVVGIFQVQLANAGTTAADQTVGAASSEIAAENASRRRVHVQNTHATETIRVGPGTVTASRGIQLQPGMSATFETSAAINAIRQGATNATVAVVEETRS